MVLADAFNISYRVINYLNNLGINYSKSAIVFYASHKIQFRYHIKRPPRLSKINRFVQGIKSKTMLSLELGHVLSIYCYTLPSNDNLTNVLIVKDDQTMIDVPHLLEHSNAEDIIIQFEKDISLEDLKSLIPVSHRLRNPIYPNDTTMEIPVEMAVDYGRNWYDQFKSFYIEKSKDHTLWISQISYY